MRVFKVISTAVFAAFFTLFSARAQPLAMSTTRPVVDMISAKAVSTNKIKITWKLPKDFSAEAVLIYKNTQPFTSVKNLEGLSPEAQLSGKAVSYTDTVTNYRDYYYAVIARLEDGSVYKVIIPSVNATVKGVKVSRPAKKEEPSEEQLEAAREKTYETGTLRELPLPYLDLIGDIERKPNVLSKKVMDCGIELAQGYSASPKEKLEPYFFDQDLFEPGGGDDYFLFEVLKNYFVKKDYKGSVKALQEFLGVNRTQETTDRAVFYLGQAQYFNGNYRNALTMFLFVEDSYPVLSKKWINSCLDFYELPVK